MSRSVLLLATCCLLGAADPAFTAKAPWTATTIESKPGFAIDYPGTGWPALSADLAVEADSLYVLEWTMLGNQSVADMLTEVKIVAELTYQYSIRLGNGKGIYRFYFHSGNAATAKATIHLNPGPARRVEVGGLALRKLADKDLKSNLLPDGNFEAIAPFLASWRPSYGAKEFRASIAPSEGFMSGEKSMLLDGTNLEASEARIESIGLPVVLGKTSELTFWAKAKAETAIVAGVNGWFNPHKDKHFYKEEKLKIGTEWKPYTITVAIPSDVAAYPDLKSRRVTLSIYLAKGQTGSVLFDDISFTSGK